MRKITSLDSLKNIRDQYWVNGQKVVLCHGCFDLVHYGHIKHFEEAKKYGDILIVSVTQDIYVNKGPNRPFFNQNQRLEYLAQLSLIDHVVLSKFPTAIDILNILRPDFYVKGQEYEALDKDVTGNILKEKEAVEAGGGQLVFTHDIVFSSSSLLNQSFQDYGDTFKSFIAGFKQEYKFRDVVDFLDSFKDLRVLVIGDIILDEYVYLEPRGVSSKSPNVSLKYLSKEMHLGGSLAIARHLTTFVKNVSLVSLVGDQDAYVSFIQEQLPKEVEPHLFVKTNSVTTRKTRYIDFFQKNRIFEIAHVTEEYPSEPVENDILTWLSEHLNSFDLVILTDFGHHFITPFILKFLEKNAKFLSVNVQTNSLNFGFNTIKKINRADYISIDKKELQLTYQDRESNYQTLMTDVFKHIKPKQLSITLGGAGTCVTDTGSDFYELPVLKTKIVDTVGSGDAYLAISSLAVCKGACPKMTGFLGNLSGNLATQYIGNQDFIRKEALLKFASVLMS